MLGLSMGISNEQSDSELSEDITEQKKTIGSAPCKRSIQDLEQKDMTYEEYN